MQNKSNRKKIITASVIITAVIIVIVLTATDTAAKIRLGLAADGVVKDGILSEVDEDKHIEKVPEGEIRYLINKRMVFESPYALGDVMLENPESSAYDIKFMIYNAEGKTIYESDVIKPGQYVEKDKLSAVVEKGEHFCSYSAAALKDGKRMGEVTGSVTVVVN